ncbi:hypothetical protein [Nocardiopsis sp. LOL_012]|uniref:restriction system modified-DNA reader domain-containing protein n=1 Tax=Nocardiopsis sp. LOL_012 TaxID=3345409 RepID=UPI003A86FDA7
MRSIRIDDEVFEKLQGLAEPFVDTPNSTLRRLLNLDEEPGRPVRSQPGEGREQGLVPLLAEGKLVEGQELVWYRRNLGREHTVVVQGDGALRTEDGALHATPSSAASALAGNPQNGWAVFATSDGRRLKDLR